MSLSCFSLFAQESENCFSRGETNNDEWINKKVAAALNEIKMVDGIVGNIGKKVKYTGRHKIFDGYTYHKNVYGIITGRIAKGEAAFEDKNGKCVIKKFDVYQEAIESGKYGEPYIHDEGFTFSKYKSCDCVMATRDWLNGDNGSATDSKNGGSQK